MHLHNTGGVPWPVQVPRGFIGTVTSVSLLQVARHERADVDGVRRQRMAAQDREVGVDRDVAAPVGTTCAARAEGASEGTSPVA